MYQLIMCNLNSYEIWSEIVRSNFELSTYILNQKTENYMIIKIDYV